MNKDDGKLFQSVGVIRYYTSPLLKVIVEVDQQVVEYYKSFIPKWIDYNDQMYPAHISVVRKEIPPNMQVWEKYQDKQITFQYSNQINCGEVYWWINAYSVELEELRLELELPVHSLYTLPPSGFNKCFHITLANMKANK